MKLRMNRWARLAVMLWGPVLVTGVSCARWRKVDTVQWCCDDADTCLAVIQDVKGPDPGLEHETLSKAQACAIDQAIEQGPSIIPRLIPLLEHADSRVRNAAARALGWLERRKKQGQEFSTVPALIKAAEREPRGSALRALVSIDDARALPLLRKHLADLPASSFAPAGPNVAGMMLKVLEDPAASQVEMRHIHDAATLGNPSSYTLRYFDVDKAVLFPRLRALLRRELEEPELRRPPDAVCTATPAWSCTAIFDGCAPRAAYIVSLILSFMRIPEGEAWEEIREAFRRGDPRLTPVALDALAAFRSPDAVKPLVQELSTRDCQLHALRGLYRLGPVARSEALEPMAALLESQEEGWMRAVAARALVSVGGEEAYGPLRRALETGHTELQAVAAEKAREDVFRKHAAELIPLLEKLAEQSSSPLVRHEATVSLAWLQVGEREDPQGQFSAVSKRLEELAAARREGGSSPGQWRCPTITSRSEGTWEVKDGNEVVVLQLLSKQAVAQEARAACSGVPDLKGADIIEPLGEGCLVGHNNGEFGGSLSLYMRGERTVLAWMNAERILKVHGAMVVLSGLMHLFLREGALDRVERTASGEWRAVPWVVLPGAPVAYGYDKEGNLVLATELPPEMTYSEGWKGEECFMEVVRITRDGQLASMQGGPLLTGQQ